MSASFAGLSIMAFRFLCAVLSFIKQGVQTRWSSWALPVLIFVLWPILCMVNLINYVNVSIRAPGLVSFHFSGRMKEHTFSASGRWACCPHLGGGVQTLQTL